MAVYFISDGEFVKIGYSANPDGRLGEIQTGSPKLLTLIATMPGDTELEQAFHYRFAEYRTVGEWFQITGLLAELLTVLCKVFPVSKPKKETVVLQDAERQPPLLPGTLPTKETVEYHFKRYTCDGYVVEYHERKDDIVLGLPGTVVSGENDIANLLLVQGDSGEPTRKWHREIRPRTISERLNEALMPMLYGLNGVKVASKEGYGTYVIIPKREA